MGRASKLHSSSTRGSSLSFYAKIIMLIEAGVICFLSLWLVEQYEYDQYFQGYVNSTVQANLVALELGTTVATFLAAVLFAKVRRAQLGQGRIGLEVVGTLREGQAGAEHSGGVTMAGEASRKEPGAPPALAEAAVRVLKRMGPGQGSLSQPLFQKNHLVLKRVESEQPVLEVRPEVSSEEKRTRTLMGVGSRQDSVGKPSRHDIPPSLNPAGTEVETRQASDYGGSRLERLGMPKPLVQGQPPVARPAFQKPETVVTGLELGRSSSEKRFVPGPPPMPSRVELGRVPEQKPADQTGSSVKPVRNSPGPLENPMPDNALIPIMKRQSLRLDSQNSPVFPQRPLVSSGLVPAEASPAHPVPSTALLTPRITERVEAIANKLPAQNIPLAVGAADKMAASGQPSVQGSPLLQRFPEQSRAVDKSLPESPSLLSPVGPAVHPLLERPSEQKPLPGLGRVEPVRGVMDKPSALKPAPDLKREGPGQGPPDRQLARPTPSGPGRVEPVRDAAGKQGGQRPVPNQAPGEQAESTDEKRLYQRRPAVPRRVERHGTEDEDDNNQLI